MKCCIKTFKIYQWKDFQYKQGNVCAIVQDDKQGSCGIVLLQEKIKLNNTAWFLEQSEHEDLEVKI